MRQLADNATPTTTSHFWPSNVFCTGVEPRDFFIFFGYFEKQDELIPNIHLMKSKITIFNSFLTIIEDDLSHIWMIYVHLAHVKNVFKSLSLLLFPPQNFSENWEISFKPWPIILFQKIVYTIASPTLEHYDNLVSFNKGYLIYSIFISHRLKCLKHFS